MALALVDDGDTGTRHSGRLRLHGQRLSAVLSAAQIGQLRQVHAIMSDSRSSRGIRCSSWNSAATAVPSPTAG